MAKLFVTGSSGFIGRNLVEKLSSSHQVLAPSRSELDLTDTLAVESFVSQHRFDVVVHAATGRSNRKTTAPDLLKNNCRMFFNLVRLRQRFGRLLHLGSGAEFGVRVPLMREEDLGWHIPADDYALSKYIAAQHIESLHANIYNLRLFGVFGKYEDWQVRMISNAICRTLFDMPVVLRQNARFDYVDVDDLARILEHFIEHEPTHRTYNVCRGDAIEIKTLAEMVIDISGKGAPLVISNDTLAPEYSGNNGRLMQELDPFEFTPIRSSIDKLYEWYSKHRSSINSEALRFDG